MISNKAKKNSNETIYVANLVNITYGYNEVIKIDYFEKSIDVEFEGSYFKAPYMYDSILKNYYGDYMELPPIEKRISHHNNNWWFSNKEYDE